VREKVLIATHERDAIEADYVRMQEAEAAQDSDGAEADDGEEAEGADENPCVPYTGEEAEDCCICLAPTEPKDLLRLEACGHVFGRSCLEEWWKNGGRQGKRCPFCRKPYKMLPQTLA